MSNFRLSRRRSNALPLIVGTTVVLAMLPASWLGWTRDISDLVRIPVTPISHVGMMLAGWIRPAVEPSDLPTDIQDRTDLAVAERDQYRQLYHAQMLRANEFAAQLRELQALPETALRNPQPPIMLSIDVTGIRPSEPTAIIECKLASEFVGRIQEGDIAIVGRDIVGRVARVGVTRIEVRPSTHADVGLIRGAIVSGHPANEGGGTTSYGSTCPK